MKITISVDDGHIEDLKVYELLKKYKLNGIFYVSSGLIRDKIRVNHPRFGSYLLRKEFLKIAKDFEIGGHSRYHPMVIRELDWREQWDEINIDRLVLQEWTGQNIESFCYPRGRYSEETINLVKKAGYKWARVTEIGFGSINDNIYRRRCFHFAQRREYESVHWLDYCKEKLVLAKEMDQDFIGCLHGWEINEANDWKYLENFFKFLYDNR